MAETKRKEREEPDRRRDKSNSKRNAKQHKPSNSNTQRKQNNNKTKKKTGPPLPSSLQKELERLNPTTAPESDEEIDSDDDNGERGFLGKDFYEYEEEQANEESRKNKHYDAGSVDELEYELPDELSDESEDETVQSDEDYYKGVRRYENDPSDDSGEEDDGRHTRNATRTLQCFFLFFSPFFPQEFGWSQFCLILSVFVTMCHSVFF